MTEKNTLFDSLMGKVNGERFVIELKVWYGKSYHEKGERQLADYLEHYHLNKGDWAIIS